MKKYAFGVDIGGTTVKLGLFETDGNLFEMWEIPTRTVSGGKFILGDISEAAYEKLSERGISHLDVEGIGMGVPGPVGQDGTVFKCVNLGWDVFNVERELGELTGMRVKAGNDANVAALGEMWQGGGKGCSNIVMITLGTGVGGGVIIDGHILAGYNGAAGEIGHLPMTDDETECCGCGKKGCLEQYASATGIVRMTKKYLDAHKDIDSSLRSIETFSAKDIFDAAKAKDETAVVMVSELGRMLGKGLAQIACVVNPEAFVIGGGVAKAGDILLDAIREHYVEYAFHASRDTEFRLASLGNEAGIYGGVKLIIG